MKSKGGGIPYGRQASEFAALGGALPPLGQKAPTWMHRPKGGHPYPHKKKAPRRVPFHINSYNTTSLVRADRDAVRCHQKDADQRQHREDAVVSARNRFGSFRQIQTRRHGLNENDSE